ncbi:hypothetical protein [Zhongshania sp.]|uniref:hypothetical protein n=1 Tax=Zhongshania sp. TaxID=1971902 RepID=UPI0035696BED
MSIKDAGSGGDEEKVLNDSMFRFGSLVPILALTLFFAAVLIGQSRQFYGALGSLKYISIVVFALSLARFRGATILDFFSIFGLVWFFVFSAFFTLFNLFGARDILVLFGYGVCILCYIFAATGSEDVREALRNFLWLSSVVFVLINIPQLNESAAFSFYKQQFSGVLSNPNIFAGLAGFYLVFLFESIFNMGRSKTYVLQVVVILFLLVFLFAAFSRGVLLAVVFSLLFSVVKKGSIRLAIALLLISSLVGSFMVVFSVNSVGAMGSRELFEDTGRYDILLAYIDEILNRKFILGTGVSIDGGRIKSELSYFDIILFSGIGAVGFFAFLFRSLYFAIISGRQRDGDWVAVLFVYIFICSTFEGYAANVASLPSLFLYLLAGLLYSDYLCSLRLKSR